MSVLQSVNQTRQKLSMIHCVNTFLAQKFNLIGEGQSLDIFIRKYFQLFDEELNSILPYALIFQTT